jgi:Arc/MetJ-type ribon-helix-helix transcriptional regulator
MPTKNYRNVTLKRQLVERVEQIVQKLGTYHSIAEFISEAVRLRFETIERQQKTEQDKREV